jgi:hypothetical protein
MRRSWRISAVCLMAALVALPALAEHTRFWRTTNYSDFERGTPKGVALWSDGKLVPAAAFGHFADPNLAYLWALRTDSKGQLYASGGSNARVFRFDKQGHPTTVFQSSELTAQAIAFDSHDNLYVGTSPDGKVYKVTPDGKSSVFFDPKTKYIWSLAIDRDGVVYVGTGDKGEIYAVTPSGKSALFYKSDERHIRALAFDGKGDLIAGTDPSGLVIRIAIHRGAAGDPPTAGDAFVIYETAGQEITALDFGPHGNLYAASIGAKHGQETGAVSETTGTTFVFSAGPAGTATAAQAAAAAAAQGTTPQPTPFTPLTATPGGSHVYRIAPDGSPKMLWESRSDLVYSLGFSPGGKLLLGTGNSGEVIELEGDEIFSKVAETASGQVTGFATGPDGRVFLCTANPGKVFTLGPGISQEGTFTSAPFDAGIFSRWGRLNWWGEGASAGQVTFYARSGNTSNPDKNWSRWYGPYTAPQAETVGAPPARFVQWKVEFHPKTGDVPSLSWVSLAYLPKNVAPAIDDVVMEDPGIRVRMLQIPQAAGNEMMRPVQLRMPQAGESGPNRLMAPQGTPAGAAQFVPPPQGFRERGWQSVLWSAHDENGDQLEYSVYYRGEKEQSWKLLKKDLREPYYSWDTTTMPDGAYYLKIVASDAPSNPPAQALEDTRIGPRFVVDNTPPAISGLVARTATDDAVIEFSAKDPSSPLARAEYSIDAGTWTLVRPVGQLSDAPSESYRIELKNLSPGEHTISVRVFDLYENSGIAKITFTVTTPKPARR